MKNTMIYATACKSCGGLGNDCPRCDGTGDEPVDLDHEPDLTIEEEVIALMIATLAKAGWVPIKTYDGQDIHVTTTTRQVLADCFAADESHIWFHSKEFSTSHWVYVINGNEYEAINDNSYDIKNESGSGDTFGASMDLVQDEIDKMEEQNQLDQACPACNGTGEGQTDGSRCASCHGKG